MRTFTLSFLENSGKLRRYKKRARRIKSQCLFCLSHPRFPKRGTVGTRAPFNGRRTLSNNRTQDNERRPIVTLCTRSEIHNIRIRIHRTAQHLPAIRFVALSHILAKGQIGRSVYADVVLIIKNDELAQTHSAGKARSL